VFCVSVRKSGKNPIAFCANYATRNTITFEFLGSILIYGYFESLHIVSFGVAKGHRGTF
jgi:hypothetical protein